GGKLDADYLKVAHHGSDTSSTPAFLDAVRPAIGVISSGVRNRYRHPRPTTLQNLELRNIAVARTDRLGSITWITDGANISVHAFAWAPPGEQRSFHRELYPHAEKAFQH